MLRNLLLATLCASCATTSPQDKTAAPLTSAPSEEVALVFAWPKGAEAIVTETLNKGGTAAVERYRVTLVDADGGQRLLVVDEFKMLSMNGDAIDTNEERAAVAGAEAMASAIPKAVIDETGQVVDVVGIDELIARVVGERPAEDRPNFEAMLRSPQAQALLQQSVINIWDAWVGGWAGRRFVPGVERSEAADVEVEGGTVAQTSRLRLDRKGDHVVVQSSTSMAPADARKLVEPTLRAMLGDKAAAMPTIEDVQITSDVTAEVEPRRLLPLHVVTRKSTSMVVGGQKQGREEMHEYAFEWRVPPLSSGR